MKQVNLPLTVALEFLHRSPIRSCAPSTRMSNAREKKIKNGDVDWRQ